MESSEIKFEIKDIVLDYETFKRFNDITCKRLKKPINTQNFAKYFWIVLAVLFFLSFISAIGNFKIETLLPVNSIPIFGLVGFLIFVCFLAFFALFLVPKMNAQAIKKVYDDNTSMRKSFNLAMSEQAFSISSANGELKYSWGEIFEVMETKYFLAIYHSKMFANVIPIKYFDNKTDIITFIKNCTPSKYITITLP